MSFSPFVGLHNLVHHVLTFLHNPMYADWIVYVAADSAFVPLVPLIVIHAAFLKLSSDVHF